MPFFHANFPCLLDGIGGGLVAVGVQPQPVGHLATGRKYPERERLPVIAEVLRVSMRELVGDMRL